MIRSVPSLSRPRVARLVAAILLAIAVSATGTTALASTPTVPAPEPTTAPEPEPTVAAPTIPGVTVPPDDSGDDTNWLPIVLIVVGGVALIAIIAAMFGRRSPPPTARSSRSQPAAPASSPQSDLLDTSQWIHDEFSIQLLAATPPTAISRWSVERSRLDSVAIGAHQLYVQGGGEMWQRLEQVMTLLATAIDTNLQLRAQAPPNMQLIAESADTVNRHRATLQQAINVLRSSLQR